MPFIVGVQYKTDEVRSLCGGLVRVNMYKDQVGGSLCYCCDSGDRPEPVIIVSASSGFHFVVLDGGEAAHAVSGPCASWDPAQLRAHQRPDRCR